MGDAFQDLYAKDALLIDVWEGGSWNPRFPRRLNDWELEDEVNFFRRLPDHPFSLDSKDTLVWRDTKSGTLHSLSSLPIPI